MFYLVWNEQGRNPTVKHDSVYSARDEAERLARKNPGQTFHVLALMDSCRLADVIWANNDEEIPF
jgi:hypothetical protein